ncbi:unnamed protein product [Miscanthus lutarioriparius]|uniref:RING-type domain-containing protein n=1 Tax=Miscanthus lutarioriparius TaxID=422564 RepID=A0A811QFC7_9POAL|nr:unnamed protein product [Miscanthus lutarioriparius]
MDDVDMTQLLQALLQRLTARSREVSAAAQEHGHATPSSAVGARLLAGAVGSADADHEAQAPRDNGGTLPGGGHLQLLEPFEHEATSLEEVTEMLQRGLSGEYFDQIMEFAMRLPEHDDIGDILERIYDQAVAAGALTPLPEDSDQHHEDDDMLAEAEQIFYQALAAEVLIPLPEWLDLRDNDGVDGGRGFGGGVPASSGVVAGLEKRKYERSDQDEDSQCPICLMDYAVDDDLCVMPCKHGFHHECLAGWLARSCLCPLCRHVLMPSEEQDVRHI